MSKVRLLFFQKIEVKRLVQFGGYITAVFAALLHAFCEQIFDLTVYAAEIVLRPCGNCIV